MLVENSLTVQVMGLGIVVLDSTRLNIENIQRILRVVR